MPMAIRCDVTFVSRVPRWPWCIKMWYPSFISILLSGKLHLVISLRSQCDCYFVTSPRFMLREFTVWFSCDRHLEAPLWSHHLHCIGLNRQIKITQWNHMVTIGWPTVGGNCEVTINDKVTRCLHFAITWGLFTKQLH